MILPLSATRWGEKCEKLVKGGKGQKCPWDFEEVCWRIRTLFAYPYSYDVRREDTLVIGMKANVQLGLIRL